jgi:LPS O-antigen subunit length determinant protein (WzzB/FepE family)
MNTNNNQYIQEDEIDLRELWNTLMKRKFFIIGFTAIVTILAIVWALTRTPMYEAKALVEIGNYKLHNNNNNNNNNKSQLDNASQLVKKLNVLFIDMYKNKKDRVSEITSIAVPKKSNNFIEIKSLATSNELATKEIDNVVSYIKDEHKKILDDVKQRRELEIKNIDTKINNIKNKEIVLLSKKIDMQERNLKDYKKQLKLIDDNISKIQNTNPSLAALKLMEKRDLSTFIINLNMQLMDMRNKKDTLETTVINELIEKKNLVKSMMLPHNYKNSEIVGEIITNDYPVKPKKKLIVVVAFVTGLILSIFLVFFMNFIRNEDETNS